MAETNLSFVLLYNYTKNQIRLNLTKHTTDGNDLISDNGQVYARRNTKKDNAAQRKHQPTLNTNCGAAS